MMQCSAFQRHKRPKLFEVKEKLIEMHDDAGTCVCYF